MTRIWELARIILATILFLSFVASAAAKDEKIAETPRLIVRDRTNLLSPERFELLTQEADQTLLDILKIWSTGPMIRKLGKIRIEVTAPPIRNARGAVFYWAKEEGHRVRTVRLYGIDAQPQGLAHKLTVALFPSRDKLIRNMMGIYSEKLLGNPNSFPICGFSSDTWVQALLQLKSNVPLSGLGPDHTDWGMKIKNKEPVVLDQSRRHTAYAEAGSFGEYLIRTYGINTMKQFVHLSYKKERPWKKAFGLSLDELEADWLRYLNSQIKANAKEVAALKRLIKENSDTACAKARRVVR
jgi:hypothetical protein